jgi:protease PrsW
MNFALLALAVAPGLAIAFFIYSRDKEKEPGYLLRKTFLWGMLSTIPAILIEQRWHSFGFDKTADLGDTAFYALIVVALSEEIAKFFFLRRYIYRHKEFNEPFDGIVYSVMIALGFATLENIFYAYSYGIETTIWRMFTAVPSHAADGIIMGYFVGMAKFKSEKRTLYLALGLFGATLFHGAYDFSLMQSNWPEFRMAGALFTLAVAIKLSFKAIRIHRGKSPYIE